MQHHVRLGWRATHLPVLRGRNHKDGVQLSVGWWAEGKLPSTVLSIPFNVTAQDASLRQLLSRRVAVYFLREENGSPTRYKGTSLQHKWKEYTSVSNISEYCGVLLTEDQGTARIAISALLLPNNGIFS
jgi:hypothetical protein